MRTNDRESNGNNQVGDGIRNRRDSRSPRFDTYKTITNKISTLDAQNAPFGTTNHLYCVFQPNHIVLNAPWIAFEPQTVLKPFVPRFRHAFGLAATRLKLCGDAVSLDLDALGDIERKEVLLMVEDVLNLGALEFPVLLGDMKMPAEVQQSHLLTVLPTR